MNIKNLYLGTNRYNYDWIHLLDQYKKVVTKNDLVLEIGSSNPPKTRELAKHCKTFIGLEKDPKKIVGNDIINDDWTNLSKLFPKNRFDIIIASHVIEHVEDGLSCINQTYDALKTGGYFLFTTPNRDRLFERLRSVVLGKRTFPYHDHKREYLKSDIIDLIGKSKFHSSQVQIQEFVFGLHASPVHIFIKEVPDWLKGWANFLEVTIKKNFKH